MAALIAPRPFMVERGHDDPVGLDDWVAAEYAKVRGSMTGWASATARPSNSSTAGHTINGVGTFEFLHKHLNWPTAISWRVAPWPPVLPDYA